MCPEKFLCFQQLQSIVDTNPGNKFPENKPLKQRSQGNSQDTGGTHLVAWRKLPACPWIYQIYMDLRKKKSSIHNSSWLSHGRGYGTHQDSQKKGVHGSHASSSCKIKESKDSSISFFLVARGSYQPSTHVMFNLEAWHRKISRSKGRLKPQ